MLFDLFRSTPRRPDRVRIPRPPHPGLRARTCSQEHALRRLRELSSAYEPLHDRQLAVLADKREVGRLARWLWQVEGAFANAGYGYEVPISDCDDSAALALGLRRMLRTDAPLLAARITVRLQQPTLGIAAGLHMSTAWATEEDWHIVEPATGLHCPIAEYRPAILRHHTQ